jgi:hypothetical protein
MVTDAPALFPVRLPALIGWRKKELLRVGFRWPLVRLTIPVLIKRKSTNPIATRVAPAIIIQCGYCRAKNQFIMIASGRLGNHPAHEHYRVCALLHI